MYYTDIHSHMLCGTDDGAENEEMMYAMLDASYAAGTRRLALTPHYQPAYYGDNRERARAAFERLSLYAQEKYPDMELHLANELGYHTDCKQAVAEGRCRLLGGKYLLMDFLPDTSLFTMCYAMDELLAEGYSVVLAHVERYGVLRGQEALMADWVRRGALFQVNASSFSRRACFGERRYVKRLMRRALIHIVASDSHDLIDRPPSLREAEEVITARFGADVAELLLSILPKKVLKGQRVVL